MFSADRSKQRTLGLDRFRFFDPVFFVPPIATSVRAETILPAIRVRRLHNEEDKAASLDPAREFCRAPEPFAPLRLYVVGRRFHFRRGITIQPRIHGIIKTSSPIIRPSL